MLRQSGGPDARKHLHRASHNKLIHTHALQDQVICKHYKQIKERKYLEFIVIPYLCCFKWICFGCNIGMYQFCLFIYS